MKNKIVGIMLLVIAAVTAFIVVSFNKTLNKIALSSCSDLAQGLSCPHVQSFDFQTNLSLAIIAIIALVGIYLIFFGKEEIFITKIKKIKTQTI